MKRTLYYFHDPMCSWCYGFKPTLAKLKIALPNDVYFKSVLGGLAADTMEPMPQALQTTVKSNWRAIIKKIPNTQFNFDFWSKCQPIRSTYPACRAVLVAKNINDDLADKMTTAIQHAYYLQAQNPSLIETLVDIAVTIGIDKQHFIKAMQSSQIEAQLKKDIATCRSMEVSSFPSLVLQVDTKRWHIALDYNHVESILEEIEVVSHL